jgi:two-component system, LytTR family, response regulator
MDAQRAIFEHKMSKLKKTKTFLLVLIGILGVTVVQDFLQSRYQSYSFYFSESLLFSILWILFLPITLGIRHFFQKSPRLLLNKWNYRIAFILSAVGIHIVLYALLIHLISWIFMSHTFHFWRNLTYTLFQDLYKYLFAYSAISLVPISIEKKKRAELLELTEFIWVTSGRKSEKISIREISFIQANTPYVEIYLEGKKYLHADTLKSLEKKLDQSSLVRIHKSTLVNLDKVQQLKSRLNGDYDVLLSTGEILRLSRNYVAGFRAKQDRSSSQAEKYSG